LVKISVLVEAILLGALSVLAFIGSRHTIQIFGIEIPGFVLLMVVVLGLIIPLRREVQDRNLARQPFILFSFILLYAALTIFTGGERSLSTQIFIFPLVLAFLAMVVPYKLTALIGSIRKRPQQSIFRFSVLITVSLSTYAVRLHLDDVADSRLASPLGGAADVHVGLLLTLAAYVACAKSGYRRILSLSLAAITIALIILTGSRAGLASALILSFLMALDARRPGRSVTIFASLGVVFVALLQILPTDRFGSAQDTARGDNLLSGLHILDGSSMSNVIFGQGSGRVWPWYGYENGSIDFDRTGLVQTDFGYLLTNPHSVILGTLVELGIVGLTALLLIFFVILRGYRNSKRFRDRDFLSTLFLGILWTLPSFTLNYYLFKGFPGAFIWWYFVFFALTLSGHEMSHSTNSKDRRLRLTSALRRHSAPIASVSHVSEFQDP